MAVTPVKAKKATGIGKYKEDGRGGKKKKKKNPRLFRAQISWNLLQYRACLVEYLPTYLSEYHFSIAI
jgi:hypothetical protein